MIGAVVWLRQPWVRIVAVLWLAQVISEMAFGFALPFIPLYLFELGVVDPVEAGLWAGAMAGTFAISMAVMGPIWGGVADRFGRRLMVQRALFGAFVIVGAMGLVQNPEQLLALRVAQGAVTGVVAATTTLVSLIVPRERLGTTLGLMHAAMFAGASIGPLIGGLVADALGYRAAFAATGGLFLVAGILVTLFVPEPRTEPGPTTASADGATAPPARRWDMLAIVALTGIVRLANMAPQPVLPLFVQQLAGPGTAIATTTGVVIAAAGIASTISALAIGRLVDRYGRRRVLVLSLLGALVLSPLQALVASVAQLVLARIALGLALGGTTPALQAILTDATPRGRRGAAFGWQATASALGNGGGPVAGSLVAASAGVPMVFIASAPVFALGAWLAMTLPGDRSVPGRGRIPSAAREQ